MFKEKGKCVRILNAGSDIVDECTYEIKDKADSSASATNFESVTTIAN